jgi:hypothetical protein
MIKVIGTKEVVASATHTKCFELLWTATHENYLTNSVYPAQVAEAAKNKAAKVISDEIDIMSIFE